MVHFGLILLICWMFFRAFNQPELFRDNNKFFKRTKGLSWELRNNDKEKQAKTLFLEDNIKKQLSENKWYLLPNLTLEELAKKLDTAPQILSATINSSYGLNFSSLINSLRIEHAKELLKSFNKTEKSISEIMYDCGFVSKSSFNTIFKSKTGVTPSQFRELEH
ncbi:helix-turn-helix transcriptional regulator [uncultured Croceitalea sp.]|uniref:helix-turn-helix domain-containing protein n=1 Tax=uncultured Croceitalea sp. TaxID=1798908 RepID=UPI003305DDBE